MAEEKVLDIEKIPAAESIAADKDPAAILEHGLDADGRLSVHAWRYHEADDHNSRGHESLHRP